MATTELPAPDIAEISERTNGTKAAAAGLFGYSISDGIVRSFNPIENFICELEQMPNFTPRMLDHFAAQYVKNNIGVKRSSS